MRVDVNRICSIEQGLFDIIKMRSCKRQEVTLYHTRTGPASGERKERTCRRGYDSRTFKLTVRHLHATFDMKLFYSYFAMKWLHQCQSSHWPAGPDLIGVRHTHYLST
jgi:hypothetical protein